MAESTTASKGAPGFLLNGALLVISCVFAFGVAEIAARILFAGSNLGWHDPKVLSERIQDCADKNGNVAIFGDSFVEYFKGSPENMTQVIEQHAPQFRTCNFGFSGTGLDDYLVKWEKLAARKMIDKAIFVIFTGNDYDDYFLKFLDLKIESQSAHEILPVSGSLHETSNKSKIFEFLKRSVALNAFWRFGFKKWFPQRSFAAEELIKDPHYGTKFKISPETIASRIAKIPKDLVTAAQSDHINVHILKRAVFDPEFFQRIHSGYGPYGAGLQTHVNDRIQKITQTCHLHQVACAFTFVELDVFTDVKHHPFYLKLGYLLNENQIGPSRTSLQLQEFMTQNDISFATSIEALKQDTAYFLPQDGHLSVKGHQVLGKLLTKQLKSLQLNN